MVRFDVTKPSAVMIGRWQPWHEGHTKLFKKGIEEKGQVVILCEATEKSDDNPYSFDESAQLIRATLEDEDYTLGSHYIVMQAPSVGMVISGKSPDWNYVEHEFGDTDNISSTQIRKEMKDYESERVDVGEPQEG